MRRLFQWSDEEVKDSGYASSATVSSIRTDRLSVHIADNGNDDLRRRLKAQKQTSKAQQEALDNIQLAQLLTNRSNNDTGSNHNGEEHHNDEQPKADCAPIPRDGDATVTYIRRSEIPSCIYSKLQYRQESEAEAQW